jgi:hypothetical protein
MCRKESVYRLFFSANNTAVIQYKERVRVTIGGLFICVYFCSVVFWLACNVKIGNVPSHLAEIFGKHPMFDEGIPTETKRLFVLFFRTSIV